MTKEMMMKEMMMMEMMVMVNCRPAALPLVKMKKKFTYAPLTSTPVTTDLIYFSANDDKPPLLV